MKALIWNYARAVAALYEARALNGNEDEAGMSVVLARQSLHRALVARCATMVELDSLLNATHGYALAFSRERMAYRYGIGEKTTATVARIKAQRELFAQLAK